MDTIQRHCADRRIHSGVHELCGRCRVQNFEGSNRLEAPPSDIQSNKSEPGSPESGPVCFPSVDSASTVFQLVTRPNGRGNRCLQSTVGEPKRLCESSVVSDRLSSVTSEEPTSSSDPGGRANQGTQSCWGCCTIILDSFLGHRDYCSQSPAWSRLSVYPN